MIPDGIQVAVGIIINDKHEVLLSRRPYDVHQGGLWEFPGGKLEAGEDIRTALDRELREELGVRVEQAHPFLKIHYSYPDRSVTLNVWRVDKWHGEPYNREGQPVRWINIRKLSEFEFPPPDAMIIKALQLPPLYLISPGPGEGTHDEYLSSLEDCIRSGARLLQLRCREETYHKSPELVTRLLTICRTYDARLLLNSTPATAVHFNAHGVHLNSPRLLQLSHRPLDKNFWVSASCHNSSELMHACRIGVDFIVLSPVQETASHPEAKPLGWDRFSQLVELSSIPVYALGGMLPQHMHQAWKSGALGVAMLGNIWSASNPADVVRQCMQAGRC